MIPQPTLYNQTILDDDDFVASFVARRDTLETMCRRLKSVGPEDDGQHQILIGTRGMGKTSLLRRLAIETKRDHDLSDCFVPLMFREEQYNVLRLRDFWRNCGESLAEWAESQGRDDLAEHLDHVVFSSSWDSDDGAAEQFEAAMQALSKRAVLLIDNLDLILDALKDEDRWILRANLQARGGPILIGAATQSLKEGADRDAAFYEFFQPHYLEPLKLQETETCMRALANQRGEVGRRVLRVMHTDPARLRVLHRLTGGNPRVLALTYRLLETEDSHSAMADLERLLDEVTPYYKARVEEYQTPLQRAIIDAIALHWDPVTTGHLSDITGVPTTTLSPQLTRLRRDGLIERIETSGSYAGHQVVERFLNIWYLMRHGTRRTRQRMRWLVAFLSSFYCKDELEEIGRSARTSGRFDLWTRDYVHAFEQATQIAPARERLGLKSTGPRHDDMMAADYPASPEAKEAKEMGDKGVSLGRDGEDAAALETYEALIARYGDSDALPLQEQVARAMVNKGITLGQAGDPAAEIEAYEALIARYGDSDVLPLQEQVARAMANKGITLGQAGDPAAALETYEALIARYGDSDALPLQEQVARAKVSLANRLIDTGAEADRAELLLKSVTESHKALAYGNLFWLYVASREFSKARETLPHLEDMPTEGRALMDAALAVQAENFGDATEHLDKALQGSLVQESWNFTDDLERLLRLSVAAGFGERFVDWFEETRLADRYAPIHAALKAAVHGEARLLDVNPETRHAAGLILPRLLPSSKLRKSK
ncbi:MAG: winged helix-turn-helix domain-containing protein [Pseudomonadota bacterium]